MSASTNLSKYQIRHIEHVKNQVAKAIGTYEMIDKNDRVLVAVSGGKDSLVLLEALSALKNYHFLQFDMEAIHIDVEDVSYEIEKDKLQQLSDSLSVNLHFKSVRADIESRGKKSPCFVCSWHRRKELFSFAVENGFQKLAFGHHMDDAAETLLINMVYHGHISSLPGKLDMFDGAIQSIRPLILLTNKDTSEFARIRDYPQLKHDCPFEDKTYRTKARDFIKQLETIHPKAKRNLFKSLRNIDKEYLP